MTTTAPSLMSIYEGWDSHQWTIWHVLSHDLHHGGELALLLGLQGIDIPDLGERGGHLTELSLADRA